jgi:hypothetical protein
MKPAGRSDTSAWNPTSLTRTPATANCASPVSRNGGREAARVNSLRRNSRQGMLPKHEELLQEFQMRGRPIDPLTSLEKKG